jgi:hypothetical protein
MTRAFSARPGFRGRFVRGDARGLGLPRAAMSDAVGVGRLCAEHCHIPIRDLPPGGRDYEGHSLAKLGLIAAALERRVEIRSPPVRRLQHTTAQSR